MTFFAKREEIYLELSKTSLLTAKSSAFLVEVFFIVTIASYPMMPEDSIPLSFSKNTKALAVGKGAPVALVTLNRLLLFSIAVAVPNNIVSVMFPLTGIPK